MQYQSSIRDDNNDNLVLPYHSVLTFIYICHVLVRCASKNRSAFYVSARSVSIGNKCIHSFSYATDFLCILLEVKVHWLQQPVSLLYISIEKHRLSSRKRLLCQQFRCYQANYPKYLCMNDWLCVICRYSIISRF